jgi:ATP-binding cassette subfamily C protein
MPGLNRIITQLNLFKSIIPSIERVYAEYTEISAKEHYVNVPEFQFEDAIYIKDVNFRYLNTAKNALTYVSLNIKKGECLGVVGETGSGKSTFIDIILGLLKPYEGSVLVDAKFPVNSFQWHQKVGYVPQSVYLIDDTIEANIAFGEQNVDESKLNAAISSAQLTLFIKQLSAGAKTIVGERGIRLSGGERQRIAIARALYRNPEVLIFDEATSALDNETETKLVETIYTLSQDRTIIMVAHRLTTLKNCDRIVEIKDGNVEEVQTSVMKEKVKAV